MSWTATGSALLDRSAPLRNSCGIMQHLSDRRCEKPVSMRCHRCVMVATRTVGRARRAWPVPAVRWSGLQCSARRWFADGPLAHVKPPGGSTGPAQSLFRLDRSPPSSQLCPCLIRSNRRGTRSVCPVVWEGWCRDGGALRRTGTRSVKARCGTAARRVCDCQISPMERESQPTTSV